MNDLETEFAGDERLAELFTVYNHIPRKKLLMMRKKNMRTNIIWINMMLKNHDILTNNIFKNIFIMYNNFSIRIRL